MAESKLNQELRIDRMLEVDSGLITARCAQLPDDWLGMDLVRVANKNGADGYLTARYKSKDEFFNDTDTDAIQYYTLEGRTMYFGGTPDPVNGTSYQIYYYGEVPVFADATPSWVYTKHPSLYLFASLMHADLHAIGEENQAANLKALVEDQITKLNAAHLGAKASGSRVSRTKGRTFG
jgi:hypothetical protein